MPSFEEHADGRVWVRGTDATYCDTWQNFEADSGRVLPDDAPEQVERIYVPGVRHAVNGPDGTMHGGAMPWKLGDWAIANVGKLLKAQERRAAVITEATKKVANAKVREREGPTA